MIITNKKGISLIVLVITIIVIIILAGTVILSLATNNLIGHTSQATYISDLRNFQTELELYHTKQFIDKLGNYEKGLLQADDTSVTYKEIVDTSKTINDLIPSLGRTTKYNGQFQVIGGNLVYKGTDINKQNWSREVGIDVIIAGEPIVTIIPPIETVVNPGTDIVYKVKFSSNVYITYVDLTDKVKVTDNSGVELLTQPDIEVGTISGTSSDTTRDVDITIATGTLEYGSYKLKIISGAVMNLNGTPNWDKISPIGFDISDTILLENPTMSADPTGWTNGDVTVTITYPTETVTKQYSTDGTTWNTYISSVTVTTNNTTVYAKGLDADSNQISHASFTVTNIDKDIPTVTYGTNGGSGEIASTTATVNDIGSSNINSSTLQYVWDTQNISTPSSGWITFTNGATVTKSGEGTYYLWVRALDNAGNQVISKTNLFVLESPLIVNKPVLPEGMTAKKWNGSSWVTVSNPDTDTTWYDYETKQWANAHTADGSMWVWIPRYEYKITTSHSSTSQTIAVNFIENLSTTATSGYTVHPAFTFGSEEITGIWVAKFEAGGTTSAVDVKPGVISLRSTTINDMFTACRNMETTNGARYGWGTTGSGIDTHLMKNIEWGAVSYLSQSIYGKNSEVWINPNSDYITGQAGTSVSASSTTSTYSYDNMTYGINASTTGNIYGVYDMSGGAYEYTASYLNNENSSLTTYGLSLVSVASQYKDIYAQGSSDTRPLNYEANSSKKGDAVYETSSTGENSTSWFSDYSYMPTSNSPFFHRGGHYSGTNVAGVFTFHYYNGSPSGTIGFRPVFVISGAL